MVFAALPSLLPFQSRIDTNTYLKYANPDNFIHIAGLLKASHLLSCLFFVIIGVFTAFQNPEIFPTFIFFNNRPTSFSGISNQSNPLSNHVPRAPRDRPEAYLSKGPGNSAYNNILRK